MPPLYPNIVTLDSDLDINQTIDQIDPLLPVGWGIKDSFKNLQLEKKGFAIAFDAFWYCLNPEKQSTIEKAVESQAKCATNEIDFGRWVKAWGQTAGVFRPSLLLDDTVKLLYTEKGCQIVAGLATNHSGDSVGISNAFGQPSGIRECIKSITDNHPSKGIVGYGDKTEVTSLENMGFRKLGELRIWIRR